ncbi:TsaE protein, required for threonylcarbamoyladenosine t(6)A37 formation in tRNA [Clostridiaceae bacterium JG1575]|nr:TsaE protein, required for threonylcarbamoyladenosine t(6)A37 formation in tRNA [Clostridiaceae bacterium JG1575]
MNYESKRPEETLALGRALACHLKEGDVLVLNGDLAAGKTHFVKGLAEGLGLPGPVSSPTFSILNIYAPLPHQSGPSLNHFDVYRVHDEEELLGIGIEEFLYSSDVSVIEWGQLIPGLIPLRHLSIEFRQGTEPNTRIISMTWHQSPERSLPYVNPCS